jgi:hypothetical protein
MGRGRNLQSVHDREHFLFYRVVHAVDEQIHQPGMTVIQHHIMTHMRDDDQSGIMYPGCTLKVLH